MLKSLTLNNRHKLVLLSCTLLILPQLSYAQLGGQRAQFHGFIMQSFVKTDNNNYLGSSEGNGSLDYTEIGLNGSVKLGSRFQLAAQLLSRRAGETDNGEIKVDFALADYRLIEHFDYGFGLRAGRVKNPIGFYNETRDVSFTRESIVLPQSIYFERARDVSISSDGLHSYGFKQTKVGIINAQLAIALPRVTSTNTEYALLGGVKAGKFVGKPSFVGRVMLESSDSRTTIALTHVNLFMDYEPGDATLEPGFTGDGEVNFSNTMLSMKYNLLKWSFTGEYAQRSIAFTGFPKIPATSTGAAIPDVINDVTGESFYLQVVNRLNFKWNFIVRYDVLYSDKTDRDGNEFSAVTGAKDYSRFAKDLMLGLQYNIQRQWMARLELHQIDGTAWLPVQDNPNSTDIDQRWRMINLSLSYRFSL